MTRSTLLSIPGSSREFSIPNLLYINGKWQEGDTDFPVHNPATGTVLGDFASASMAQAMSALDAAAAAQSSWAAWTPRARAELLHTLYDAVARRADDIIDATVLESGKPVAESKGEFGLTLDFIRWFAEQAAHVHGTYSRASRGDFRIITTKQPVGPTLLITPWNFPVLLPYRKVVAALAAGCTSILKPAEETPYTCSILTECIDEVGVPAGVFNYVPTDKPAEMSKALMGDSRLRKVSFTGSSRAGSVIAAQGAAHVTSVQLELGGNGPFIVLEDADIPNAVAQAMAAKFRNAGQACVAANRIILLPAIAEEFSARLVDAVNALKVGPGYEPGVDVGPLITRRQQEGVEESLSGVLGTAAEVVVGGSKLVGPGNFFEPTVLRMTHDAPAFSCKELFAPVAPLYIASDVEDALRMANDTDMGLAGYLFTRDLVSAISIAERMEVGMVGVNRGIMTDPAAPFGGMKRSGSGREGGHDGLDEFLETKYIGLTID